MTTYYVELLEEVLVSVYMMWLNAAIVLKIDDFFTPTTPSLVPTAEGSVTVSKYLPTGTISYLFLL